MKGIASDEDEDAEGGKEGGKEGGEVKEEGAAKAEDAQEEESGSEEESDEDDVRMKRETLSKLNPFALPILKTKCSPKDPIRYPESIFCYNPFIRD